MLDKEKQGDDNMQVNSISRQNFGAKLVGDCAEIMQSAVKNGFQRARAKKMLKGLERMLPDDVVISFKKPQSGSLTGNVKLEVINEPHFFKSDYSGVDMDICPVVMDRRNVLAKYVEAAKLLAQTDFRHNRGVYTIA